MKKFFTFLVLAGLGVLLTGCGNQKELSCSYATTNEGYGTQTTNFNIVFEGDAVVETAWTIELALDEAVTPYKDVFYQSFEEMVNEYENIDGYTASVSQNCNNIKVELSAS